MLYGFLTKGYFPRVSPHSRLSTDDKGDSEMIPGAVHRSPGIYLTAEENPGQPQLGDRLMKNVRQVITSNELGRIAQHDREGERRKEGNRGRGTDGTCCP